MTELNLSRRRRVHGHHSGGSSSTTTTGGRNNSFHLERPYSHPRPKPYRSLSHSRNNNSNFNLRLIRYVLHGLGVLSLVLVLFLARRLEGGNDNAPSRFLDVGVSVRVSIVYVLLLLFFPFKYETCFPCCFVLWSLFLTHAIRSQHQQQRFYRTPFSTSRAAWAS